MEEQADFTTILRAFMARTHRGRTDLARLTGLSLNTIKNWTRGVVRHPNDVHDVLKLARALALDSTDTSALLSAAGHPALSILQTQAQQTSDLELETLLVAWSVGATDPSPPAPLLPMLLPRHQLRPPVADFVGREAEIDQLVTALRTALARGHGAIISGVQGMGGIGKTELAYNVAHRLRDAFPDAQIVLNLRGTSATPLTAEQALQAVIHTFAPDTKLPERLEMLEQHYRTLLHGQRTLILADDTGDAAQVIPLIPPNGSALLVTGRTRFTLPGMTGIDLHQLGDEEAVKLLCTVCPRLSTLEAQAIAHACGHLPLALRISAGILHNNPALKVARYLQHLADERQRLAQLRDPDNPQLDVAAVLARNYTQLDGATQRIFRQLGVFVADFSTDLAQAVVEAPATVDVETILHRLLRWNLIMYDTERSRWRLHDLVRDLARGYLAAAEEQEGVMWRYARAALRMAQETQAQYRAGRAGARAALMWFDVERPHIDAGRRWAAERAGTQDGDQFLLDDAQATRNIGRLRYDARRERIPQWKQAHAAAQRLGDGHGKVWSLIDLGIAYNTLGESRHAIADLEQALPIACAIGDRRAEGSALNQLGISYAMLGEAQRAIPYFEQYLMIARASSDRRIEGIALSSLGGAYMDLGDMEHALPLFKQAITITRAVGDQRTEGVALNNLGFVYANLGDTHDAIECCEASLTLARAIGDRRNESYALSYLAFAQAQQEDRTQASISFEQAMALFRSAGDQRGEAECQWLFGLALIHLGEREQAISLLQAALAYEQKIEHAKAAEHAALVERLKAVGELPPEPRHPAMQRMVGYDEDTSSDAA